MRRTTKQELGILEGTMHLPPAAPPAGGGAAAPGGGGGDPEDDDEDEDSDDSSVSSVESDAQPEDPEHAGTGKFYKAQTPNGKAMVKMFRRFCDLSDQDANAIVVYFGVYCEKRLAEFSHDHWKDTFTQWQKRHPNRDGTERAMVLSPPQQDRIKCAAWACRHRRRVPWPKAYFSVKELKSRHFEPIRAQMEREEEGKITVKMIPDLTDIPKWKDRGHTSMSKHFRDFETYLSQHYGVEGFPLDWVVRPKLPSVSWSTVETSRAMSEGKKPSFFRLEETDYMCRKFTHIVPLNDEINLRVDDPKVRADWENGNRSMRRSATFRRDDAIVLQLARAAFADSPGEIHFIPKRGKTLQSGRQAYFACKGQFVGINTARLECDLARDIIQKMRYEGESRSWNWDKHCSKFHSQVQVIDEWAAEGLATRMSNEDQISAFLKTIPKDCKNSELQIAKGIIEGDRLRFPTLVGNVIPHLTLSIEAKEPGTSVAKRTIANTSSHSGQKSDKRRRTSRSSQSTTGKLRLVDGKVVGTIEGLHYSEELWKAMTSEQRAQCLSLRRSRRDNRTAKATSTAGSGPVPMDVSGQLETLTRAVQSLDSNREGGPRSSGSHASPRRRGSGSHDRERSSSRSRGSHQSGAHEGRRRR